jgi:hypothetical protein
MSTSRSRTGVDWPTHFFLLSAAVHMHSMHLTQSLQRQPLSGTVLSLGSRQYVWYMRSHPSQTRRTSSRVSS